MRNRAPESLQPVEFSGTQRFEVISRLGAGGMGVVYKAHDREHGSPVALKTLLRLDPGELLQFKAEFRALSDLRHPNLISFGELFESSGRYFFTMELVEGKDFLSYVWGTRHASPFDETLPDTGELPTLEHAAARGEVARHFDEARLRSGLAQLVHGLEALHSAGKVHRDIKPSNILVTAQGRVVVLDFGLVTDVVSMHDSMDLRGAGTIAYMSPEQAAAKAVGPESDWYAVGAMLYEILTGRLPHDGTALEILRDKQRIDPAPPSEVVSGGPADLEALCVDLLHRDPSLRPTGKIILGRLAAEAPSESATSRAPAHEPAAFFVGRERDLESLRVAFTESRGHAVSVLVVGESGVGKSALARRFTAEIAMARPEVVVLTGRCYESEWVPFKAVDGIVDSLSRYLARLPKADAAVLLPRHAALLAQVFPVLGRVDVFAEAPAAQHEVAEPQELRRRVFAALRELFERLSERAPVVLLIDDLQWADADSLLLIRELLRVPHAPALLLVATMRARSTTAARDPGSLLGARPGDAGDVRLLRVERLPPEQATQLAHHLLGAEADGASSIGEEAGGHPLFIQELVHHRHAKGSSDGSPRLEDALWARVSRLEGPVLRLLQRVALAGGPIAQEVAIHASELPPADYAKHVAFLRVASLVRTSGHRGSDTIEAYHDRVREAVVGHLESDLRIEGHRRLALALEHAGHSEPEMLALHWGGAGESKTAAIHAVAAAARADEVLAFDRAARLYRLAIELDGSDADAARELHAKLGQALANAGRGKEAADAYLAATAGVNAADTLDLRRRAVEQLLRSGHVDEGLAALATVLEDVGMTLPRSAWGALIGLLFRRAQIRLRGLSFRERDASLISAKDLARIDMCWSVAGTLALVNYIVGSYFQARCLILTLRAGDSRRVVCALAMEACYSAAFGGRSRKRTSALVERTATMAQRLGDAYALAWATGGAAASATLEGRWSAASQTSERAEAMFRDGCVGGAWEVGTMRWFSLWSKGYKGDLADLSASVPGRIREAEDRGDLYAVVAHSTGLASLVWLAADDPDEARRRSTAAIERWSKKGTFHVEHWWAMLAEGQIDLYCGEGTKALRLVTERWPLLAGSLLLRCQLTLLEASYLRARAVLAAAAGAQASESRRSCRAAERDARAISREQMPWADPLAALVRGGIAAIRQDVEGARTHLEAAVEGFESADMALHAAVGRRRLGALVSGTEGAALIERADAWMSTQGIASPERITSMIAPGFST